MKNIQGLDREIPIHIASGNEITAKKEGILHGKINGQCVNIKALIVPEIKFNLMSVGKLTENGHNK